MPGYTRDFLASLQRRYEQTDQPLMKIAADFGISVRTIGRLAEQYGWSRNTKLPRDLSPAMRALEEAQALVAAQADAAMPAARADPVSPPAQSKAGADGDPPDAGMDPAERIARIVESELLAVEAMRAQARRSGRSIADCERIARTLSILTQILTTLQRLRSGPATEIDQPSDDDIPRDIDELREALARRIEAFVAGRSDASDAASDPGAVAEDAVA